MIKGSYDSSGHPTHVIRPQRQILYKDDAVGSPTRTVVPADTVHYTREALNRLSAVQETMVGNSTGTTTHHYDNVGNL